MGNDAKKYFFGSQEKNNQDQEKIKQYATIGLGALIGSFAFMCLPVMLHFNIALLKLGMIMMIVCCVVGYVFLIKCNNLKKKANKVEYLPGSEYDAIVAKMIEKLGSDAREYLGLDASEVDEIEPIAFEGYKFIGASHTRKDEADELWRSDLYEKVIVFFTKNEIHLYKVFLNTLTEKITETTDVLFYDDVVSVSTKNEVEKIGNNSIEYISFNLVSKGGNNVSIALNGNDNRQRSINAMRAMIKEKKTQN